MKEPPKIMVVEDEGIVAFNLQQRLQQLGYRVIGPAESDIESLSLVANERPDLVLMDIHIKGDLDGIELASLLATEHHIPVIYLTAYSEDATLERARRTRPYGYLIKPFSERELHATVQMALERHEVQTALLKSQALLEQALQAAEMGIIHILPHLDTVRMTGAPASVAGLAPDQDSPLPDLIERMAPDDQDLFRQDLGRGSLRRRTVRLPGGADQSQWLQVDAASDGEGLIQGVTQDVTEREHARAQLLLANERLEERVRDRTAELRQHVREVESFSHAAAHDLRSPIRAISGLSEMLREEHGDSLGPQGRGLLDRITRSAKRMAELIDALLGLSTLSKTPMRRESIDLGELAREIHQGLCEAEPDREVRFLIDGDLRAQADRALMRSVLDNLLRNAWKFSRERRPAEISFTAVQQDGRVVYRVTDNGCGFDSAQAENLFGAFFRLHDERHYGGFGLGLSIAQRIIARHGGEIRAHGEVGRGATISFTLGD